MHADVIVLGLGAMGSATLYQLAKRGVKVLGIDQYAPPHTYGSTHGDTRVTRLAIGEGAHYTPLAMRSHEIWREIEAETGETLLTTNGGLIISGAHAAQYHGTSFFANTIAAARSFEIPHEMLDAAAIRTRFRQFIVNDDAIGYYEPSAGFVRPEACVAAQLQLAQRHGATILRDTALSFDGASVRTETGTHQAAHLIVTAGPWLPQLAPELAHHFKIHRQTLLWFEADEPARFAPNVFPIFIWDNGKGGVYGFPSTDGHSVKIATEVFEHTTTPQTVNRIVSDTEASAIFDGFVAPHFRGIRPRVHKSAVCLYTVTPDFGFVIDSHPAHSNVTIASPCSGHGFKHSAAIGEALAQRVTAGASRLDLSPFAFARLS